MGEKIKNLASGQISNSNFKIELNQANYEGQEKQVHIQSDKLRIEMDQSEFIQYALCILSAEKKLKQKKNIP